MRPAVFVAAVLCAAGLAPAQPAALVQDVERGTASGRGADAYAFVEMDGVLYYAAWDVTHGFELWRSDGSAGGTRLVADIQPGPVGSMPRDLTAVGSTLFFTANDGASGFALWKSDGTPEGTTLLRAAGVNPGDFFDQMRFPGQLTAFGARLLFTARGLWDNLALWSSDGTPEGTSQIALLGGAFVYETEPRLPMAVAGGAAYFMARVNGPRGLWRTDGTPDGTSLVWTSPVFPPSCCGVTDLYVAFGDLVVFRGADGSGREALWRTDGTPKGTFVLVSSRGDFSAGWFTQLGSTLYFAAGTGGDPRLHDLWRTDGTPGGTSLVASFGSLGLGHLASAAGRVFFVSGETSIGVSDGTPAGTLILLSGLTNAYLGAAGDHATFVDGASGVLGVSDGTPGGTVILRDDLSFPHGGVLAGALGVNVDLVWPLALHPALRCFASGCVFRARVAADRLPALGRSHELWRSDGTTAGTLPVLSRAGRTRGSWPEQFVGLGTGAAFATAPAREPAHDGSGVVRLATTDGSPGGTATVMSWTHGTECGGGVGSPESCRLWHLTEVAGRLFFLRGTPGSWGATELWTSDGTQAGTSLLRTFTTGEPLRHGVGVVGGRFVFTDGTQIWSSDGTQNGTVAIGAPAAGLGTDDVQFTPAGGALFFSTPGALYRTAGTSGSVQLVKTIEAAELTDVAGTLYFSSHGELWNSNGTAAGTVRVAPTQHATRLTAAGTRVFFTAADAARGTELWVSDGTASGTQRVADLYGGAESSEPDALTAVGARLFFTANNGVWGRELWVTDGTREGTLPVADINPGAGAGLAEGPVLVAGGGRVYFPAYTPATGVELWSSDGTPQGTVLVQDIAPGAASASPRELVVAGGRLYFGGDDGVHGQEPWSLPLPPALQLGKRPRRTAAARPMVRLVAE